MKTKPSPTPSNKSKVNTNAEKKTVDVAIKSEAIQSKTMDNSASQEKSQKKLESNKQETRKGKYPLVHIESSQSLFDRDPKGELESHEMHPGHLVSVENVGSVPDHYRKLSDGEARNLDIMKINQDDYMKTKDRNKEKSETKKYKRLKSDEKLTLLQLSMLKSNINCTRNKKRDSFEEDPIITAYYEEEEQFCLQKLAEFEAEKNEPSKISVEITFNYPWIRKKSRNSEDLTIPVEENGSTESHHHHHPHLPHGRHPKVQEERKKSIFSLDPNPKPSKLTYKSLKAESYSVFDNDDTVFNNILEEERGTKTEFLIRLKRGTNIERHEKENQRPRCNTAYLKCYFYSKPKMFQKPKKESSTPTLIGISGEAYWDHVFILRGFTIDELENVYVLVNVKGKCREQGKEQEQGSNIGIHFDKVFRAVKGKNLSLGQGILAGKEAKIIPSPDFRYREPMKEEYQGWMNALSNPGIPQKFDITLKNEDDDSSEESDSGDNRKWHSVLRS